MSEKVGDERMKATQGVRVQSDLNVEAKCEKGIRSAKYQDKQVDQREIEQELECGKFSHAPFAGHCESDQVFVIV